MPQTGTISAEKIVEALGRSEQFPAGSQPFDIFAPHIGGLIDIVGERMLHELVSFGSLCDVVGRFVRSLAQNVAFLSSFDDIQAELVEMLYVQLADQLADIAKDPLVALSEMGITEAEFLEMPSIDLNDGAMALYRDGRLTFAILLSTSPEVFIPRRTASQ